MAVYPGADDVLTAAELATYKDMNVAYNHNNIASLQGIEFFTNLNVLNCNRNKLTSVNLSNNKQLEWLIIYRNQLTSLDMTSNTRLKYLRCWQNTTMT